MKDLGQRLAAFVIALPQVPVRALLPVTRERESKRDKRDRERERAGERQKKRERKGGRGGE